MPSPTASSAPTVVLEPRRDLHHPALDAHFRQRVGMPVEFDGVVVRAPVFQGNAQRDGFVPAAGRRASSSAVQPSPQRLRKTNVLTQRRWQRHSISPTYVAL